MTAISATVSFGYSLVGLRNSTGAACATAMYAVSRSVALLAVAIVDLFVASQWFAAAIAIAMVVVQAGDAWVGAVLRDRLKTVGPAATALLNVAALIWMLSS